jgi:energy-coupling factor transporter transmembrane protein EcfT
LFKKVSLKTEAFKMRAVLVNCMEEWYDKAQHFVDKIIPYIFAILFIAVIIEVFFKEIAEHYHTALFVIDMTVISVFVADLFFKYERVRNIPRFFRLYWLDILAVFPFFLFLRAFEEALLLSERSITTLRNLFHAGIIIEEEALAGGEAAKIARTSELLAKEGRVALFSEWFKPLRRLPRFLKAVSFYEHPKHKKTLYHKKR